MQSGKAGVTGKRARNMWRINNQKRGKRALNRHLLQHFDTDLAGSDLAQRDDRGLVAAFDLRRVTLSELTRAIGCGKREFETVRDLFEAVFDGNAGHVGFLLSMLLILPYVLDTTPRSRVRQVNAELHEKLRMTGVLRCEARARGGDE